MSKIIFITREGYDLAGARVRCYNFAQELRRYGLETEVLSFSDTLGAKSGKEEYRLNAIEKLNYNIIAFQRLKRQKNAILFLNRFHYHSFAPWFLHLIRKNRLIFDLDDWEMREKPEYYFGFWPSSKAEFLIRQISKNSSLCIAASHFLEDFLGQFNDKVYYIPSGVNTDLFYPRSKTKNLDKIVISWIGTMHRLDNIENLNFLIKCFQEIAYRYKNVILEIIGDGIYRNRLLTDIARERIVFRGWIAPDKIPEALANIDIGVVPLVQNMKFNLAKSPTKLFEYMAMGKPVVCSDMGECNRIVGDGENGFLAKDKETFIKKLESLIINPELCQKIGENARKLVEENYSLRTIGLNLYQIIKENLCGET